MGRAICWLSSIVCMAACGPSTGTGPPEADAAPPACIEDVQRCNDNILEKCTDGAFVLEESCANFCDNQLGCVLCLPGTGSCTGDTSVVCVNNGSGFEEIYCDPVQGMVCNDGTGRCDGACAPDHLGRSYIGCEYYPTTTAQEVSNGFAFAVAVSNTTTDTASVTIEDGALTAPITFDVAPNAVVVQTLPWVPELKMCNAAGTYGCASPDPFVTAQVAGGAYHLRSTQPVTVYEFSPLDYTDGAGTFTYSNDASLLLPTNAMTGNYFVAAWQYWPSFSFPGILAVTATADDTEVTINPKAASTGTPDFPANVPTTITLNRGDVVQLLNLAGDFTGSAVSADKPVQVIGGHYCSNVPLDITACDHLEESMYPTETLSTDYLVTAPMVPSLPNGKEQMIRIVATQPNTNLTYDPAVPSAPAVLANIGDFAEIPRHVGDFEVSADHKILVATYMEGQTAGGGTGDPAMTVVVPTDQYRTSYLFHAPVNYESNYVNITAPTGAAVTLDGAAVTGFTPIGASGYDIARVQLGNGAGGDGNHDASSDQPFGISVYGYGQYTSYWYPGGLDLAEIPIP